MHARRGWWTWCRVRCTRSRPRRHSRQTGAGRCTGRKSSKAVARPAQQAAQRRPHRTRGDLLVEDDFVGVQLPVVVRGAAGGLLRQGKRRGAGRGEPVGRQINEGCCWVVLLLRGGLAHRSRQQSSAQASRRDGISCCTGSTHCTSHTHTLPPPPPPPPLLWCTPHPRQHIQLLLRHPQLLRGGRSGRAAARAAHHGRRQLLQPPAQHLLQLLSAAPRPAVDHKHVQREAVLGVEGVRLADVQPQVALQRSGPGGGRGR